MSRGFLCITDAWKKAICLTLCASITLQSTLARAQTAVTIDTIASDPQVQQELNPANWEPSGRNFPTNFQNRGSVYDRSGSVNLNTVSSVRAGNLRIEQAIIDGKISYKTEFHNHPWDEHGPLDETATSSSSTNVTTETKQINMGLQWQGTFVHPADAYDGAQGGGYPPPTGARDEYSFTITGTANGTFVIPQYELQRNDPPRRTNGSHPSPRETFTVPPHRGNIVQQQAAAGHTQPVRLAYMGDNIGDVLPRRTSTDKGSVTQESFRSVCPDGCNTLDDYRPNQQTEDFVRYMCEKGIFSCAQAIVIVNSMIWSSDDDSWRKTEITRSDKIECRCKARSAGNKNPPEHCPKIVTGVGKNNHDAQKDAKWTAPPECRMFYGHCKCGSL